MNYVKMLFSSIFVVFGFGMFNLSAMQKDEKRKFLRHKALPETVVRARKSKIAPQYMPQYPMTDEYRRLWCKASGATMIRDLLCSVLNFDPLKDARVGYLKCMLFNEAVERAAASMKNGFAEGNFRACYLLNCGPNPAICQLPSAGGWMAQLPR